MIREQSEMMPASAASHEPPARGDRPLPRTCFAPPAVEAPAAPVTLAQTGIPLSHLCDLILKSLYIHGPQWGVDLARRTRLPYQVIDESLVFLKDERCVEVTAGDVIGRASYRFSLTDHGRQKAREAFEVCKYVGPAPVSLTEYARQCARQSVSGLPCDADSLRECLKDLVLGDDAVDELGPALISGRSIFLFGPPGNGKTAIARRLGRYLHRFGGDIYIPYAIHTEGSIITVFDGSVHQATDGEDSPSARPDADRSRAFQDVPDQRWRRIRRPTIATGGELTLDRLELQFQAAAGFHQAPVHLKANGGVFLIDDFGRQMVSPRELLNRWILPLEDRLDYLTLATGKKIEVPFEMLVIFSTNLDPHELVDEAFLRRIRHKVEVPAPDRSAITEIFQRLCSARQVPFHESAVDYLFSTYYSGGRRPRCCDPRELLEIIQATCRFRKQETVLSDELLAEAGCRYFTRL